jgi:hypothetical protein
VKERGGEVGWPAKGKQGGARSGEENKETLTQPSPGVPGEGRDGSIGKEKRLRGSVF